MLNALSTVTPRDHKLGDLDRLARRIEELWPAWAAARPSGASDVEEAIKAAYRRLVERIDAGKVKSSPSGLFLTLLEDLVDPAALEAELDRQDPDRASSRRWKADLAKEREREEERRRQDAARQAAEERAAEAAYIAERIGDETRQHFAARRKVEEWRRHADANPDPKSFIVAGLRSALEQLAAVEAREANADAAPSPALQRDDNELEREAFTALIPVALAGGAVGSDAEHAARTLVAAVATGDGDRKARMAAWWSSPTPAARRAALGLDRDAPALARVQVEGDHAAEHELLAAGEGGR